MYCKSHLGVEDAFGGSVPFRAEHLVPSVGHLERASWERFGVFFVGGPVLAVAGESARSGPYLHYTLFEFGEDSLFLEMSERVVRSGAW